jgi:hypothetical protein
MLPGCFASPLLDPQSAVLQKMRENEDDGVFHFGVWQNWSRCGLLTKLDNWRLLWRLSDL